jgi:hypothetical protein
MVTEYDELQEIFGEIPETRPDLKIEYNKMLIVLQNELCAPELLQYEETLVQRIRDLIEHQVLCID